jgi:dolichyl-phosphate beta-glucosyltransferase
MQLSIVLPSYNEASRIAANLETIIAFCERELDEWEIIVVDDGSIDRTAEIVASYPGVCLLRNGVNRGKGQSVRRGMLAARLDPILFSDADLSTPIEEALGLLDAIEDGADVAIASRQSGGLKRVKRSWFRRLIGRGFRYLVRVVVVRGIDDTQCGFKMFRRRAARAVFPIQHLEGWAFDVEILFIARQLGFDVREVPVDWEESAESKLQWWSPFQMAGDLFRIRWFWLTGRYSRKEPQRPEAAREIAADRAAVEEARWAKEGRERPDPTEGEGSQAGG